MNMERSTLSINQTVSLRWSGILLLDAVFFFFKYFKTIFRRLYLLACGQILVLNINNSFLCPSVGTTMNFGLLGQHFCFWIGTDEILNQKHNFLLQELMRHRLSECNIKWHIPISIIMFNSWLRICSRYFYVPRKSGDIVSAKIKTNLFFNWKSFNYFRTFVCTWWRL